MEMFCDPVLRWAGGKRWLIPIISPLLPRRYSMYYEPFLGGGAVFFSLIRGSACLSDLNHELINFYQILRSKPLRLFNSLYQRHPSKDEYYYIRSRQVQHDYQRAAKLYYLNRMSFNGLYRVNKYGEFNVPFGRKPSANVVEREGMLQASEKLRRAIIIQADFEDAVKNAGRGTIVYFDPPYTAMHSNNGFVKYNENIFRWEDQVRLSKIARWLARRGVNVFVSNAGHNSIRKLYKGFSCKIVTRKSMIAASSCCRDTINEYLFFT
ncbi:MAG: Dam family site-specific DNA-(adenine-N6)-methyltransferase [Nitrospinae bacterium]|nr:Dam family site-specific DNA-(adenine-N6)-methyltransferase [Nitrospinota bacterium]